MAGAIGRASALSGHGWGLCVLLTLGLVLSLRCATGPQFCGVTSGPQEWGCGWHPPSVPCLHHPQLTLGGIQVLAAPRGGPSLPRRR